jgi:alpha-N-acetylglucosaminidase
LSVSLDSGNPPEVIDWYAFGDRWNRSKKAYNASPMDDSYTAALAIARVLDLLPNESRHER